MGAEMTKPEECRIYDNDSPTRDRTEWFCWRHDVQWLYPTAIGKPTTCPVALAYRAGIEAAAKVLDGWRDIYGDNAAKAVRSLIPVKP